MFKESPAMKRLVLFPLAAFAFAGVAMAEPEGDASRGKTVFARCAACHDLNTGTTRLGPSLKGVVGRTSGTMPNFNYSQAMKNKAIKWNDATLNAYLSAPSKYVPGNRMAFPPMANAQDRADLIAFLGKSAR